MDGDTGDTGQRTGQCPASVRIGLGAKLARLTFRLQGQGREAVLFSSFHELDWRAEPLVFGFLRLGHEVTVARLRLHSIPIYFDLQAVKGAVGLHTAE
jgi:hypothetical protein